MTVAAATSKSDVTTAAEKLAEGNFRANTDVWRRPGGQAPGEWVFARDGSLTAMLPGERWWGNCSLPRRSAEFMLKTMRIGGPVACFLSPVHAAQIRVALDRLEREQAIVAIVADEATLGVLLHCEDFSREFESGRLWIVSGSGWETELRGLFELQPGLPTPAHFIRPVVAEPGTMDELIASAQRVFGDVSEVRAQRLDSLRSRWKPRPDRRRLCLLESSRYRPWDDAAEALARATARCGTPTSVCRYRTDDPRSASPLGLALTLDGCDGVLSADRARPENPGVASPRMPWITWVTRPSVPAADPEAELDHLLLADPRWRPLALEAGWPAERVHVAGWPAEAVTVPHVRRKALSVIVDTRVVEVPESVKQFSSQVLLWEAVEQELARDPFALGNDVQAYLAERVAEMKISRDGFDERTFIDGLIVPAWQQSVARVLAREGFPLDLCGDGWSAVQDLSRLARGPVASANRLREIVAGSTAVVHLWPAGHAHAIDVCGRPVAKPFGNTPTRFLRDVRLALSGLPPHAPAPAAERLDEELLERVLASVNLGSSKFMTRAAHAR